MKKFNIILLLLVISLSVYGKENQIVPGVTLERFSFYNNEKQIINIARVDLTNKEISVCVGLGDKNKTIGGKPYGKEPVTAIVEKNDALLGVNGDYFVMEAFRHNLNFSMVKGELIAEPQYNRSVMFIGRDNNIFFDVPKLNGNMYLNDGTEIKITGINRNRTTGDVVIYTDSYAETTLNKYNAYDIVLKPVFGEKLTLGRDITCQVERLLPNSANNIIPQGCFVLSSTLQTCPYFGKMQIGDVVNINFELQTKEPSYNVYYAIGGGPMLLQNGEVYITSKAENFKSDITGGRAPRTCVGVNEDRTKLFIVTVDGRCDDSKGMTLNALAEFMKSLGAYNAMNLDGGGSTTMSVLGLVMNSPSEIIQRNVANALLIKTDYVGREIVPEKDYTGLVTRGNNVYSLDSGRENAVWGTYGGVGYVNENNVLITSKKDRQGKIGFVYDGKRYDYNMEISNAPLKDVVFETEIGEETENGIIYHCKGVLYDKNNNLMSLSPIFVYVENGTCNDLRFISDEKGEIHFDVLFYKTNKENIQNEENAEIDVISQENSEPIKAIRLVFDKFSKTITF